jgi:hypothetical protein
MILGGTEMAMMDGTTPPPFCDNMKIMSKGTVRKIKKLWKQEKIE